MAATFTDSLLQRSGLQCVENFGMIMKSGEHSTDHTVKMSRAQTATS
jgi:hypothetical protein